jgi:hypothetical protein
VKFVIASYPRSGNHLVRGIMEFGFRQPTLGPPTRLMRDPPIADRPPNAAMRLISIEDREPIGLKAHRLHTVLEYERAYTDDLHMLLVTRNPADAITSQLLRHFAHSLWLSERKLRAAVERDIGNYLALLWVYRGWKEDRCNHLEFERLLDPNTSLDYVNAFLTRVNAPYRLSAAEWKDLQQLTKGSQRSAGKKSLKRKQRIRDRVKAQLSSVDVARIMGG